MKPKAVLVDIDGTLVSVTPNWSMERDDQWVEETLQAEPLDGGIAMLQALKLMGYELVFLTARGQSCKANTWKKFQELGIDHLVDSMWHRPVKMNGVSSNKYKEKMILMLMNKYDLKWAMEDEQPNQEMMRRLGLNVIDARVWNKKGGE
jgi:phosphoglycolate phosphatase-like HAD superfamily hydrolase